MIVRHLREDRDELDEIERFAHEFGRTQLESLLHRLIVSVTSEHEDGDFWVGWANFAQTLEPVLVGHVQIHHDALGDAAEAELLHGSIHGRDRGDLERRLENDPHRLAQRVVVIDDEYLRWMFPTP